MCFCSSCCHCCCSSCSVVVVFVVVVVVVVVNFNAISKIDTISSQNCNTLVFGI